MPPRQCAADKGQGNRRYLAAVFPALREKSNGSVAAAQLLATIGSARQLRVAKRDRARSARRPLAASKPRPCARQCARGGVIKHSTTHSRASRLRASGGSPPIRRTQPLAMLWRARGATRDPQRFDPRRPRIHPHLPLLGTSSASSDPSSPVPNLGLNAASAALATQRTSTSTDSATDSYTARGGVSKIG